MLSPASVSVHAHTVPGPGHESDPVGTGGFNSVRSLPCGVHSVGMRDQHKPV